MPKTKCMWNHHWLVKGFFANRESRGKRTLSKANHENINASLPFPFKTYIHFSFCGDRDNRPQRKKISRSPKSCSRISPPRITSIPRREVLQNPEGIRKFSNEFIMHSFNLSFGRPQPACRKVFFLFWIDNSNYSYVGRARASSHFQLINAFLALRYSLFLITSSSSFPACEAN